MQNEFPNPRSKFEADTIIELRSLLVNLPSDIFVFTYRLDPSDPEWPNAYFEVSPVNPKAARIGISVPARDLVITIGEIEREFINFQAGNNFLKNSSWQNDLAWLFDAVTKNDSVQEQYLDSADRVIGGVSQLTADGHDYVFTGGRKREKLFSKARSRIVHYLRYQF